MKSILFYLGTGVLAMAMLSNCSIEEEPKFSLNEQIVFSQPESAQLALNGLYTIVGNAQFVGQWLIELSEMASGMGHGRKAAWYAELSGLNISPTNVLAINVWRNGYAAVGNINIFISNVEGSPLDEEVKNEFIGQAEFLRAFAYLQLTGFWGGLPIRNEPTTTENIDAKRATQAEVYDQIEADLLNAIDKLSDKGGQGKINKWAARALLAKAYFLRASKEDGSGGKSSPYWERAKEQGDLVINQGPYALDDSFENLWDGTTPSNEVIFKINYALDQFPNVNANSRAFSARNSNQSGIVWGRVRSSKTAYDVHAEKYPRDPRIDATWFHTSYNRFPNNTPTDLYPAVKAHNAYGWPFFKKHYDPNQQAAASAEDVILMRYADLLLLMAEVENELGNQAQALAYVNQVLQRARTADGATATEPADWTAMPQDIFRWEIFIERQIELMGEGKTYVEMRRRGIEWFKRLLERHNANANNDIGRHKIWEDYIYDVSDANLQKNLLMPIPVAEINFNREMTIEDQNPGY